MKHVQLCRLAGRPRGCKDRGSAVAEGPPSDCKCRQPFGARGGVYCRPRLRDTTQASLWSHPTLSSPGSHRSGTASCCGSSGKVPSAAACEGLPCAPLLEAHSLAHLPRHPRELPRGNAANGAALPQPGTGPAPQQTLKLGASLVDRVAGSMGERGEAGIRRRHDVCFGPEADIAYASNLSHPHPAWVRSTCRISPFRPSGLGRPSACPSWP
jgi:hypothetical protein